VRASLLCVVAGKTQLVKGKLAGLGEDSIALSISFNYFTDVNSFQNILESPLEKKVGTFV
jgi:dynein heavy chain, axonemal